jgi:hypothetical protein
VRFSLFVRYSSRLTPPSMPRNRGQFAVGRRRRPQPHKIEKNRLEGVNLAFRSGKAAWHPGSQIRPGRGPNAVTWSVDAQKQAAQPFEGRAACSSLGLLQQRAGTDDSQSQPPQQLGSAAQAGAQQVGLQQRLRWQWW